MISPTLTTRTKPWTAVLFDLDGTITDSAHGITTALARTFRDLDLPVPLDEELTSFVGPPLLDALRAHAGFNEEQAWQALLIYRAHYDPIALNTPVFPGIAGLLQQLHAAGVPLAVATSKPERLATRILETNGLLENFEVVCGASDDEKLSAKADIVAEALRRLRDRSIDVTNPVMVGDRGYDALGAAANDVPTIMVEWGYGSPAEAGEAIAVVHSVAGLRESLLG